LTYIVYVLGAVISILEQIIPNPPPGESNLGYFILAIFLSPVVILVVSAITGKPRSGRAIEVLVTVMCVAILGFAIFTYIISYVLAALYFP
jgi:ABC-type transport system involved in cytochrome c biogenesis permease subunit